MVALAGISLSGKIDMAVSCKVAILAATTTFDVCVEITDLWAVVFTVANLAA
jgi:hypothetical protein